MNAKKEATTLYSFIEWMKAKGRSSTMLGERNVNIVFEFLYDTLISDLVLCHYKWRARKKTQPQLSTLAIFMWIVNKEHQHTKIPSTLPKTESFFARALLMRHIQYRCQCSSVHPFSLSTQDLAKPLLQNENNLIKSSSLLKEWTLRAHCERICVWTRCRKGISTTLPFQMFTQMLW